MKKQDVMIQASIEILGHLNNIKTIRKTATDKENNILLKYEKHILQYVTESLNEKGV
jgi:hypothetical protein